MNANTIADINTTDNTKQQTMLQLYNNASYLDLYGGSVVFTITILGAFLYYETKKYIQSNIYNIRKDWDKNKCKPHYMPLAGYVNPDPYKSNTDIVVDNFKKCTSDITSKVTKAYSRPMKGLTKNMLRLQLETDVDLKNARLKYNQFDLQTTKTGNNFFQMGKTVLLYGQRMISKIKNTFERFGATIGTVVASILSILKITSRGLEIFDAIMYRIIIIMISIASAIIVALGFMIFAFFAGWQFPQAIFSISALVIMITYLVFTFVILGLYMVWSHIVYGPDHALDEERDPDTPISKRDQNNKGLFDIIREKKFPKPPKSVETACFHKDTLVVMHDGTCRNISELQLGDKLWDNNSVQCLTKTTGEKDDLINIGGIIVTPNHRVKDKNTDAYFDAYCLPHQCVPREKFLYCLCTSNGHINISSNSELNIENGPQYTMLTFLDWDDIDKNEMIRMCHNMWSLNKIQINLHCLKRIRCLTSELYIGFKYTTLVCVKKEQEIEVIPISEIRIGDQLLSGEIIQSIIRIDARKTKQILLNGIHMSDIRDHDYYKQCGLVYHPDVEIEDVTYDQREDVLYNVTTDTGIVTISEYTFPEFSFNVDYYLYYA
jgi:hypothetical protein